MRSCHAQPQTERGMGAPRNQCGIPIPFPASLFLDHPLGEARLLRSQQVLSGGAAEEIEQDGDNAGPSGLVAGAEPGAVVSVEVFVEQNEIPPVLVILELRGASVDRAA